MLESKQPPSFEVGTPHRAFCVRFEQIKTISVEVSIVFHRAFRKCQIFVFRNKKRSLCRLKYVFFCTGWVSCGLPRKSNGPLDDWASAGDDHKSAAARIAAPLCRIGLWINRLIVYPSNPLKTPDQEALDAVANSLTKVRFLR